MLVWYFVVLDLGESLELVLEVEIEGHRRQLEGLLERAGRVKSRENASMLRLRALIGSRVGLQEIMLNERVCAILTTWYV